MRWENAVVVITGANGGVGRAVVSAAAQRGAQLGLIGRSPSDLRAIVDELSGRRAFAVADVGDEAATTAAIEAIERALGPVDVLVCAAGVGAYGPFHRMASSQIEQVSATNVMGVVHAVRAVLAGMIERRRGHIVLIGSIAGQVGVPLEAMYSATKFAIAGLGEALGIELAEHGIGVSVVSPGPVATGFFDARGHSYERRWPRPIDPARVARAVLRAVDRDLADVVVPPWLRIPTLVRHLSPGLFRRGARRANARQLKGFH